MGLSLIVISEPPVLYSILSGYEMCVSRILHQGASNHQSQHYPQSFDSSEPTVFGHRDFKGKQKAIVEAAVAGEHLALPGFSKGMSFCLDTGRDVFVLAPTGMGKVCIGS